MSFRQSNESIIKQLCSGILSGSVIGILISKNQYFLSYVTFTSIGLIDIAYHFKYLKAHITHLTYDRSRTQREIQSGLNNLQRNIRRDLRDPSNDVVQELEWLWNDVRRYIDGHIYYGMGFTMAFLTSVVLMSKKYP